MILLEDTTFCDACTQQSPYALISITKFNIAFWRLQCWHPKNAPASKPLNYLALSRAVTKQTSYRSDAMHLDFTCVRLNTSSAPLPFTPSKAAWIHASQGMGNSSAKFDIISNLPRELVAIIICQLSQRDVANCLLVSHSWNDIIRYLAPYWWSAIERHVGLSREAIVRSAASFSTPKALFITAKKYKAQVGSNKLRSSPVDYFPAVDLQFTLCWEAKEMMIVRSQKLKENSVDSMLNQNCQYGMLVERVNQLTSDCGTELEIEPIATFPLINDTSVAWAHVAGDIVYWVTRRGMWRGVNYKSQEEIFSWKNNLLNNGCGVTITCCKDCSMLVASQWMPLGIEGADTLSINKSAYALQVVSLGSARGEKEENEEKERGEGKPRELVGWKMFQSNHNHPLFLHHDSRYWIRETLITSKSHGRQMVGTLCHKHTLVVQSDHCTVIHTIETEDTNNSAQDTHIKIGAGKCINCTYKLKYSDENGRADKHYSTTRHISSAVNISSDESLLGMVFKNELYVWKFLPDSATYNTENTAPATTDLELTSRATLKSRGESSGGGGGTNNSITLVALGHNLSIIAYHNDTYVMDYRVNVVMTHTGEVLMEFRRIERFYDWTLCCQVDPLHKFYFMMLDEEWLNTIQSNNTIPSTPIVTLHNHHGRLHTEAIQCYKPGQTWKKHGKCFMQ